MDRTRRLLTNTMVLTAVRVIVPLMSLGVVLALSRMLGADGLGRYTLVFTILYVVNTVAPFGLYALITREGAKSADDIPRIMGSALALATCTAVPMVAVMAALGTWLGYDAETVSALRILSLAVVPFVVIMLCEAAFVAIERVKWVAAGAVIDNGIKVSGAVFALLSGYGLDGVVIATVAGKCTAAVVQLALLHREGYPVARPDGVILRRLASAAPTFLLIQIFATIYWRIDVLMLSKLGGDVSDVGYYGAAYRIFELVMIVPQSLCLALYPQVVQAVTDSRDELNVIGTQTLRYLAAILLPATVAATLAGGRILALLYGESFAPATTTLAVLIWAVLPFAWVRFHAYVLVAVDQQRVDLLLNVIMSAVNVALNFMLIPRFGHLGAAVATLISIGCYSLCQFAYLRSRVPEHLGVLPRDLAPLLAAAVMALTIVLLDGVNVLVTLAVAGVVYLAVLVRSGFFDGVDTRVIPLGPLEGVIRFVRGDSSLARTPLS